MKTTDLCDQFPDKVKVVVGLQFQHFGKCKSFYGAIETVKCFEDNSKVKSTLETPGGGRVLVVDGGGSLRCALLGDMLADLAVKNNWSGIVVFGLIRDSEDINDINIGVMALGTIPLKSNKRNEGQTGITVSFGGVTFTPGQFLYADADGIIVSETQIK